MKQHLNRFQELYIYLLSIVGFGCLYWLWGADFSVQGAQRPLRFWEAVYFSAVAGTTVGFGDIAPLSGPIRLPVVAQAVLIPLLFARFVARSQARKDAQDTAVARLDRMQFVRMRLHQELGMLLHALERQPRRPVILTFKTSSDTGHVLRTEFYHGDSTSVRPLDNRTRETELVKLRGSYKSSLEYALFQLAMHRVSGEIPPEIETTLRKILRNSKALVDNLNGELPEGAKAEQDAAGYQHDQLQQLDAIVLMIYEIFAEIEAQDGVVFEFE